MCKDFLIIVFFSAITIVSVSTLVEYVKKDIELYRLESECVAKYIKQGHKRSQIETHNGTCSIKTVLSPN